MWRKEATVVPPPEINFRTSSKNVDYLEMAYKDAQLEAKLASDISKALLEKNEQNERVIADLREMDEMKTEKIEQLELQCLEYAAKLEEFQQQFAGSQATNENLRKNLVSTKLEVKELHQQHLDFTTLKKDNQKLTQQVESLTVEMEQARLQEAAQQKILSRYVEEKEQLLARQHKLEQKLFQLEEEVRVLNQKNREVQSQKEEVEELIRSVETKEETINRLKREKESLEGTIIKLEKRKPKEMPSQVLTEPIQPNGINEENEDEQTNGKELAQPEETEQKQSTEHSEYFFMIAAAIRAGLAAKHPDQQQIFDIDPTDWYQEALSQSTPFYEWYTWLSGKFNSLLSLNKASPTTDPIAPPRASKLEEEVKKAKRTIEDLEVALNEARSEQRLHEMQQEMLKKEIRALDRLTKREQSINYEYLRNVIVEYLSSTQPMQQQTLANVITTLLECNQAELERIRTSGGKKLVAPNSPQQQPQSSLFSRVFNKS